MTPTKPLRALTALAAVSGALAIAPVTAGAATTTFCVNVPSCPAGGFQSSLPAALSGAHAGAGPADILLGPKPDGTPYVGGPFDYGSSAAGNTVRIIGKGRPVLTSSAAGKPVLSLGGPGFNDVSGIDIVVPALPGADGLRLDGTRAVDVQIRGGGGTTGINRGVVMSGGSELRASTVDMKSGFATELVGGPALIDNSTLKAPFGIIGGASDLRLDDSRVHAEHKALQMINSSGGNGNVVPDGVMIVGSELTTSAPDGEGIFLRDLRKSTLIRTTVASTSAAPQAGKRGLVFECLTVETRLVISTSVIGGYPQAFERTGSAPPSSELKVFDSEWDSSDDDDGGDAAGPRSYSALVQAEPRFVDRVGGDLRLRGGDGAIDLNSDPNADAFSTGSLNDVKVNDGNGDGQIRSDAGAYEYARTAPVITSLEAAAPKFTAEATDADGEAVELAWDFGDGSAPVEGGSVSHILAPGQHAITLTARDEAGVTTTKTFGVTIDAPPTDAPPVPGTGVPGTEVPGTEVPGTGPVAPSGGTGPAADRAAPLIRLARIKRGRGRTAKLTLDMTEAATLRITIGRKARTIKVKAGRGTRVLKALPRRRTKLRIVATDAAGNRSAAKVLRLRRR